MTKKNKILLKEIINNIKTSGKSNLIKPLDNAL